jgi:tRNA G46 methylase TrmB
MSAERVSAEAIWHDVECGSYQADLPLWEELAQRAQGAVLELGCGTGRVALHLARRG